MQPNATLQRHFDEIESRLTTSVSERMLDLVHLNEGQRVLDLASGRGELALRAAARVGTNGYVLGIDLLTQSIEIARARAAEGLLSQAEFQVANAEDFIAQSAGFDVVTSRWGLMYMRRPDKAFESARRALRPGDRLVAAFWAEPHRVPWWSVVREVTSRYVSLPPIDKSQTGPLRFATKHEVERAFTDNGFTIEHVEEMEVAVIEATTATEVTAWARTVFGKWVDLIPAEHAPRWEADFERTVGLLRQGKRIALGGVTTLVSARST